jgi:hypothetical protein
MKYFLKEIIQTPLRTLGPNGKIVVWEKLAQNYGVLALADDDPTAEFLAGLAARHVGGVSVITAEQYDEYKKKLPYVPPPPKPQLEVRVLDMNLPKSKKSPGAPAPPIAPLIDPLQEHVRAATARALAANAEARKSAISAAVEATSDTPAYFKPKVGRPKLHKPGV